LTKNFEKKFRTSLPWENINVNSSYHGTTITSWQWIDIVSIANKSFVLHARKKSGMQSDSPGILLEFWAEVE
jgi:hypothetical protein